MTTVKLNYSGKLENIKGDELHVSLNLVQFNDDGVEVLYAPALEVYGYGNDFKEAQKSLDVCLREFINYTINKGTFESELERLGWKIKGSKSKRKYTTPTFSDLLINNNRLVDIVNTKDFRTHTTTMPLAMA